jgi:hypothetical protein
MPKRIDSLTKAQKERMPSWADEWIAKALSTEEADWTRWEDGARAAYEYADIPWPNVVVRVSSPIVLAFAAPAAALAIELIERQTLDQKNVGGAVDGAVGGAVDGAVRGATFETIRRSWSNYIGGQFWAGGYYYWGGAYTSFFREVCKLDLEGDLWNRARAYEKTIDSACWWWPHRKFVMVCDRPREIHREQIAERGWGSHRMHREDGPSIRWADGWALWSIHGVRVTQQIVEAPETLTPKQIRSEQNLEIRRIMLERFGYDRYLRESNADKISSDDWGELWRLDDGADVEPIVMVECLNSTPEEDGSKNRYMLRVDQRCRPIIDPIEKIYGEPQKMTPLNAIASTFGLKGEEYIKILAQT